MDLSQDKCLFFLSHLSYRTHIYYNPCFCDRSAVSLEKKKKTFLLRKNEKKKIVCLFNPLGNKSRELTSWASYRFQLRFLLPLNFTTITPSPLPFLYSLFFWVSTDPFILSLFFVSFLPFPFWQGTKKRCCSSTPWTKSSQEKNREDKSLFKTWSGQKLSRGSA